MTYLQNCWYVAAWASELEGKPLGRRLLDAPVVLYRTASGEAVALEGRCPHRFAPLHMGKVVGSDLECPYHGLRFAPDGACTLNPQNAATPPKGVAVKTYPLVERHTALWIWMGEAERADPALIPDFSFLTDDRLAHIGGYLHTKANYELLTDNILDLSHVDFLHATSLGCEATARAETTVRQEGDTIYCDRWMPDDRQGPLLHHLFEREGKVDAWVDVRWQPPALMTLTFGMADVGAGRSGGVETQNAHFMTPETRSTTHYFWAGAHPFKVGDAAFTAQLQAGVEAAFVNEDKPIVEAQQAMLGEADFWASKPRLLAGDAAGQLAHRQLTRLIEREQAGAA